MKTLFLSASYSWSDYRTRKPLIKFNKTYYNYLGWKFNLVTTFSLLKWRSISQFLNGFGQMIEGECWPNVKLFANSLNVHAPIFLMSSKKDNVYDEIEHTNSGYERIGLVQMAYRLIRTFTVYIWSIAVALSKALLIQPAWKNQNSIDYHASITPHIPPLIIYVLAAEEPGLFQKITF